MFWEGIDQLNAWARENLGAANTPQGSEVLMWLVKSRGMGRPLKDLYRSSRYSEPTIRAALKIFVDADLVEISTSSDDLRTRIARPTVILERRLDEYVQRFRELAAVTPLAGDRSNCFGVAEAEAAVNGRRGDPPKAERIDMELTPGSRSGSADVDGGAGEAIARADIVDIATQYNRIGDFARTSELNWPATPVAVDFFVIDKNIGILLEKLDGANLGEAGRDTLRRLLVEEESKMGVARESLEICERHLTNANERVARQRRIVVDAGTDDALRRHAEATLHEMETTRRLLEVHYDYLRHAFERRKL